MNYQKEDSKIRIMIVDDSLTIRKILNNIISTDPDIEVVGIYNSAEQLLIAIETTPVDILLLDIEMPKMNGIEAIPHILKKNKSIKIFMVSALTTRNAPIAIQALTLGAIDYIEKPDSSTITRGDSFQENLISKIKTIAHNDHCSFTPLLSQNLENSKTITNTENYRLLPSNIILRTDRIINFNPKLISIAASTGGPKAITDLLIGFGTNYLSNKIVIITQHMPAVFTKLFAKNLDSLKIIKCQEAQEGDILTPGNLYIAPGNKHMKISINQLKKFQINLDDGPAINFCKPSANPMIESAAKIFKNEMLTIILTGMGKDALEGSKIAVSMGGSIIAQDKNSSIVWGMPGNVALNNLCSAVLPLNKIANFIIKKGSV